MARNSVLLETRGAVCVLTLNRPPVNALNMHMYQTLSKTLKKLRENRSIRVVVLTSTDESRAFCAGADIKEFGSLIEENKSYDFFKLAHEVCNNLESLPQVTIGALNGVVLGGGAELVLSLDFRIASENAQIGFPEITVGQFPGTGGTMRLPWLVGESIARSILLTGDPVSAERALSIGLFHQVVACKDVFSTAEKLAVRLSQYPAHGIVALKRSLLLNRDDDIARATERDIRLSEWVFRGYDSMEGQRAFIEKRAPNFLHKIPDEPDCMDV